MNPNIIKKHVGIATEKYDILTRGVSSMGVVMEGELVAFKKP